LPAVAAAGGRAIHGGAIHGGAIHGGAMICAVVASCTVGEKVAYMVTAVADGER
jgi:hypothetical protein